MSRRTRTSLVSMGAIRRLALALGPVVLLWLAVRWALS
jgi:cell division septal protein FtsQ